MFLEWRPALASAGPGLLVYGFCGVFVFLILRAMASWCCTGRRRLRSVLRPRVPFGEKAASLPAGCNFLNWAMTTIVDSTAIATYCHYWKVFESVPQWLIALIALALVFAEHGLGRAVR